MNKPEDGSGRIFVEDPLVLGFYNLGFPVLVLLAGAGAALLAACSERGLPRISEATIVVTNR